MASEHAAAVSLTSLRKNCSRLSSVVRRTFGGRTNDSSPPSVEASPQPPASSTSPASAWFWEHYSESATEILEFLGGDDIRLGGKRVADIGCGDGIIDLGVAHKAQPEMLVGFDVNLTDTVHLLEQARTEGVADRLPACLDFRECRPRQLPYDDDAFDVVFTWSAFEHMADPTAVLSEVRRVLRPFGTLMLQLWPFFHSEHGAHLEEWFPEGFVQLLKEPEEIEREMRERTEGDDQWMEYKLREFHNLNRITVDQLQDALLANGFRVAKLELLTHAVHIPVELARHPLSLLGLAGVKLLASLDWA